MLVALSIRGQILTLLNQKPETYSHSAAVVDGTLLKLPAPWRELTCHQSPGTDVPLKPPQVLCFWKLDLSPRSYIANPDIVFFCHKFNSTFSEIFIYTYLCLFMLSSPYSPSCAEYSNLCLPNFFYISYPVPLRAPHPLQDPVQNYPPYYRICSGTDKSVTPWLSHFTWSSKSFHIK